MAQLQTKPPIQWSTVEYHPSILEKLNLLTTTSKVLIKEGYRLNPLTEQEVWSKMRCLNCGAKMKRYHPTHDNSLYERQAEYLIPDGDGQDYDTADTEPYLTAEDQYAAEAAKAPRFGIQRKHHCFFHDGTSFKGVWQCCGGRMHIKSGCCSEINHTACDLDEVREQWQFYTTPEPIPEPSLAPIPQNNRGRGGRQRHANRFTHNIAPYSTRNLKDIRPCVALDCEMGTPALGTSLEQVLIRVSLVDFFTQEPLVDQLVAPDVPMLHYNTKYSGVTFAMMKNAIRQGLAIRGVDAARERVLRYVDASTIIIVHGGDGDFKTLRLCHPAHKIIDTHILEAWDIGARGLKRSLKDVCMRRCGISVQDARLANGRSAGHDSLEDALACREIVCTWLRAIPNA